MTSPGGVRVAVESDLGEPGEPPSREHAGVAIFAAIGITVVALLPALVAIVRFAGRRYYPTGDAALIDLHVRDVWSHNIPLVGAYSRFGWNHPGPALFWIVAPLSLLAGRAAWATLVGCTALSALGVAWSARLGWRLGGLTGTVTVVAVQLLGYVAVGSTAFVKPWNPYVAFPVATVLFLQVWQAGLGDTRVLPGAVVVASLLVQTHIGYLPFVLVGVVWVLVSRLRGALRAASKEAWRRMMTWAALWTFLLWLPPAINELVHPAQSNVRRLVDSLLLGRANRNSIEESLARPHALGLSKGLGILAAEFRWLPPWAGGGSASSPGLGIIASSVSRTWLLIPIVLLILGFFAARRMEDRRWAQGVGLVTAFAAVSILALASLRGEPEEYAFYWRIPLALGVVAVSIAAIVASVRNQQRRVWICRSLVVVLLGAIVWSTVRLTRDVATTARTDVGQRATASIVHRLIGRGLPTRPVIIRGDLAGFVGLPFAVFDELDRRGVRVRTTSDHDYVFGEGRTTSARAAAAIWYVLDSGVAVSELSARRGARVIASVSPLAPRDENRLRLLQRRVYAALRRAHRRDLLGAVGSPLAVLLVRNVPGVDPTDVAELSSLNRKVARRGGLRSAVVAFAPADAPKNFLAV